MATLVDTNVLAVPSDFNSPPGSVTINWGDGQTTPGTVVGTIIPGLFQVDGSHTYAAPATFITQVTVTDQSSNSGTGKGFAVVLLPPLSIAVNTISGTAGQPIPTLDDRDVSR